MQYSWLTGIFFFFFFLLEPACRSRDVLTNPFSTPTIVRTDYLELVQRTSCSGGRANVNHPGRRLIRCFWFLVLLYLVYSGWYINQSLGCCCCSIRFISRCVLFCDVLTTAHICKCVADRLPRGADANGVDPGRSRGGRVGEHPLFGGDDLHHGLAGAGRCREGKRQTSHQHRQNIKHTQLLWLLIVMMSLTSTYKYIPGTWYWYGYVQG